MLSELQILEQLKDNYDRHLVSALVGCGFTKNMYPKAPSWNELLKDLVMFAYDSELHNNYEDYCHKTRTRTKITFEKYCDSEIENIIKQNGYLNVVSRYIEKKGCREAIDLYLEEKNPFFFQYGGKVKVKGDRKTIFYDTNLLTHRLLLECNWQHIFTTNFDNALELVNDKYSLGYTRITNDYQLSREKLNRSIVKIHGNLVDRSKSLDNKNLFEFDGDKTRRYIISREDFDTYFEKHTAFSYLLRIALLSGVYCLMGFSGDDPNFLGWLEWVKDILDKEPVDEIKAKGNKSKYDQIKVFLILIDDRPIPDERLLFYRNHHIGVIHLKNGSIQKKIGMSNPSAPVSDMYQHLFSYLKGGLIPSVSDGEEIVPYYTLWRSVYNKISDKSTPSLDTDIDNIVQYKERCRFVSSFSYQEQILSKLHYKESLSVEECEVLVRVMDDLKTPSFQLKKDLTKQLQGSTYWQKIIAREDTFEGASEGLDSSSDYCIYENVLRAFYHFDFEKAKRVLKEWKPKGNSWKIVKASANYLFDKAGSLKTLGQITESGDGKIEQYISAFLYDCIEYNTPLTYPLDRYKGLDGLSEILNIYLRQIDKRNDEVQAYGIETESSFSDADSEAWKYGLRALHLIADSGLNPCYAITNVINIKDWYKIFRNTYQIYPWPNFYYSCQYNNRKALKRIGQDYAYAENLADSLTAMLSMALECLTKRSLPAFMRFGAMQISGEFFVAVPENEWYSQFLDFLRKCFLPDADKYIDYRDTLNYVSSALCCLSESNHISECLTELLSYYFVKASDACYLLTACLRIWKLNALNKDQQELIKKIADGEDVNNSIYVIQNFDEYKLLPEGLCESYLNNVISNESLLHKIEMRPLLNLSIMAKHNVEYRKRIASEILSREFWGRAKGTFVGGNEYFFRFTLLPDEYSFTKRQKREIASKLEAEFREIIKIGDVIDGGTTFFHYDEIREMKRYIDKNPILFEDDFRSFFIDKYQTIIGCPTVEEGFYSDSHDDLERAVGDALRMLSASTFNMMEPYYEIAVQRLSIKDNTSNTSLLFFVAKVLIQFTNDILLTPSGTNKLLRILTIYAKKDLRFFNFQVMEAMGCFIKIADVLSKNGLDKNESVQWWLDDDRTKRFNYVEMFEAE